MIASNTLWAVAGAVVILANGQGARAAKPWRVVDHRSVAESCLFWLLCLMGCCVDSEAASERVVKLLEAWNKPDSPGMAWTVVSNGVVLERGAFGLANLEQRTPITPSTRFNIGSMSKQFTALAALKLEQEGKLSLDDDVRRFVPELPNYGRKITLRHLIHHTSGLQDWDQLIHLAGWRLDDVITHENVLRMIVACKDLNFDPGERYAYSNSGYSLLATVIERAAGSRFGAWMKSNVFEPLDFDGAVVQDNPGMIIERRAESYQPAGGGQFRHLADNAAILGAGSIYCSIEEFAKYLQAFDDSRRGRLLTRQTQRSTLNDGNTNDYACGVELGRHQGLETISHGGGWAGFRTWMLRIPERKLSAALFSNHGSVAAGALVSQIADVYLGLENTNAPETIHREIGLDSGTLVAYVGQYELAPGLVISITKEDDHLMSQATGYPKEPLFAESKSNFFFKVENSTMTFVSDTNGAVAHLLLNRQGQQMQARRMKLSLPSPEALAEYAGDYVNADLESKYTIRVREGGLVLLHARHGDTGLVPLAPDTFTADEWWLAQVRFTRDKQNQIAGFQVAGGRIRPVLFKRQGR